MILSKALKTRAKNQTLTLPEMVELVGGSNTTSGEHVSAERSKTIASAYRAGNILSDDVAKLPFQQYRRNGSKIEQVQPDGFSRNIPYLIEVSPNLWGWTPFQFKKSIVQWQIYNGNAYVWRPPVWPPQLLILPADVTYPVMDKEDGSLWYLTTFSSGVKKYIPAVEILHLLINPDRDGFLGRGVIQFARETIGRQLGAHKTQSKFFAQGLNPAGYLSVSGQLEKKGRQEYREAYGEAMEGSNNAYRLAIFDSRVTKFEPITMKPVDAQFLEMINATDHDISNFFGIPEYKLNSGKQSYQSNEQNNLDYLSTSLDPYLVQWEQGARIKWLSLSDQGSNSFKFVREALLRTDALTRAQMNEILIRSGQRNPNEAREKDDYSSYDGGDVFHISSNYPGVGVGGNNATQKN